MFLTHDIRQSRVYQEAMEEGREQERQRWLQIKREAIPKLAALDFSPAEIAKVLTPNEMFVQDQLPLRVLKKHAFKTVSRRKRAGRSPP